MQLDLEGLTPENKQRAKAEAAEIILEGIEDHLDRSTSPVSGGEFKKKKIDGQNSELLLFGDMRASLEARLLNGDAVEIGIFDGTETPKAFGHNTDFQGHPFLAGRGNRRQFIPNEGEDFKRGILSRVKESIADIREAQRELTPQELLVQALNEVTDPAVPAIALGSTGVAGGTTLGALLGGLFGEG